MSKEVSREELEKQVAYYRRRVDQQASQLLQAEFKLSGLEHEMKQRQQGFSLLVQLQQKVAGKTLVSEVFAIVSDELSRNIGFDRTVILVPTQSTNMYTPSVLRGFHEEEVAALRGVEFEMPPSFGDGSGVLVVNKAAEKTPITEALQQRLGLPFFVALPIMGDAVPLGVILTGRLREARPLFPPLGDNDVETLRAISGLVSATVKNLHVAVLTEMDRLKTEFFANISHEFRTPITLTLGPLEGMRTGRFGELTPSLAPLVETMERNQRRLLSLVNQILDLTKLESGGARVKVAPLRSPNELVAKVTAEFTDLAHKRGLELITKLSPRAESVDLYVDVERIDRLLFNLLSNAIKFTKRGKVTVETDATADAFVIAVSDTGIGIREDQLPFIFDRFRQADGSASREFAGTGLGLALVKEIVRLHGGSIMPRSVYGQGTTFDVRLPLGRAHLDASTELADAPEAASEAREKVFDASEGGVDDVASANDETLRRFDARRPTVLFVDDNQELRGYVRGLLASEYNVFVAPDGAAGLEAALARRPDLVLSDRMMPKMTGTELCAAIRREPSLSSTPVVLLTAKTGDEDRLEGLSEGADDYLSKPFSAAELLARIRNLVRMRRQHVRLVREIAAARGIQQALLPPVRVERAGVTVEGLWKPSDELSGDFYDVLEAGSCLYVYVADVTSHGAAAAQVTYLLRESFRNALDPSRPSGAPELLADVAKRYAAYGLPYDVGIQLVRLDLETREAQLVRGNAPAAFLLSGDACTVVNAPPGPALSGEVRSAHFPEAVVKGGAGDRLYLVTDGAYEFMASGRPFGLKRLRAALLASDSDAWRDRLWSALAAANEGESFGDDLTVVRIALGSPGNAQKGGV